MNSIIKGVIILKKTPKFVFFYGTEDVFSNFHACTFKHQGKTFKSSEQAVMYRKALLFGATKIADAILRTSTPNQAKALGRSKEIPFDESIWEEHREKIYFEVLMDKFSIPKMCDALLNTGNRILVEASPRDTIWGVGLSANNPLIQYPNQWKGLNLLGKTLMKVRKELLVL